MDDMNAQKLRAWEIMKSIGVCFFVTKDREGEMQGRPMEPIIRPEEGRVYLLTHESEAKTSAHALADGVLLVFSRSSENLSLNGSATVVPGREKVKELWSTGAQAYWPDGPETPGVVAVEVNPTHVEYWDGSNSLVSAFKLMYARVTHSRPELGVNKKLAM